MTCVICDGAMRRLFEKNGFWILVCEVCGHRAAELARTTRHVERVYDDSYFRAGGAGYPDYHSEARILRQRGRWYARLLRRHRPTGRVLDVGAAAGFVLQGLFDSGWSGRGVEPNARMAAFARDSLGLDVTTGTLEELPVVEEYDLVAMIQVVSHFVDPRSALQAAARHTAPGGHWLIETWNRESRTARIFGSHWHEYSPPSVLHWFSPHGLRRLAAEMGFREIARGRPSKWIGAAHVKSLLRSDLDASRGGRMIAAAAGLIPDRVSIPYPGDDLFWSLFERAVPASPARGAGRWRAASGRWPR